MVTFPVTSNLGYCYLNFPFSAGQLESPDIVTGQTYIVPDLTLGNTTPVMETIRDGSSAIRNWANNFSTLSPISFTPFKLCRDRVKLFRESGLRRSPF